MIHGKTHLRRARNGVIVNWFTLLQSTGHSVSNDTWFVMLWCLVSKPFNTKLSIRWWDWRLLEQTVVFWHTLKLVWWRMGMAFIVFYMALLQFTCNSVSNDIWFVLFRLLVLDPFDTKLFTKYGSVSVATAYYVSNNSSQRLSPSIIVSVNEDLLPKSNFTGNARYQSWNYSLKFENSTFKIMTSPNGQRVKQ